MKTAIITTTINIPFLLENYIKDVKKYKRDCFFVVVGDKKTPSQAKKYCLGLKRKYRADISFLNVPDQQLYLKKFPELARHLPYNCVQRRNIGTVLSYEKGADVIIALDDDNYIKTPDFVGRHAVGISKKIEVLSSSTGWFNSCDFLSEKFGRRFYHRGFPLEFRFEKEKITKKTKEVKLIANVGLWLGEPDIDALVRLYYENWPIVCTSYKRRNNFAVERKIMSPFNSQNTAVAREAIPALFWSPHLKRYDDIWASYIIEKIAHHLGHYVSFGHPLAFQKRNLHNNWKDLLIHEAMGMSLTDRFAKFLRKIKLTQKDYGGCYKEIAEALERKIGEIAKTQEETDYLKKYLEGMKVWIKTFKRLSDQK